MYSSALVYLKVRIQLIKPKIDRVREINMRKAFIKLFISLHTFFYKLTGGKFGSEMGEYRS